MNIDRVQLFVTAARHLSITRAATEHLISQPAVTRQLKILQRDELGFALFRNRGRGIVLTEAGRAFYDDAVALLLDAKRIEKKHGKKNSDSVNIAANHRSSKYLLPALMTEFSKTHPSAKLTLHTRSSIEIDKLLLDSNVDLAITSNPTMSRSMFVTELYYREPLTAFVAAGHPLAWMDSVKRSGIVSIPLIIKLKNEGQSEVEAQLSRFEKGGVHVKSVTRYESPEVVKEFVKRGTGVGLLYNSSIKRGIERGEFKAIQIPGLDVMGQSHIVYSKGMPLSSLARDFLSYLRASVVKNLLVEAATRKKLPPPRNGQMQYHILRSKLRY
jgi:LysR family cys regulon transcriptional activator